MKKIIKNACRYFGIEIQHIPQDAEMQHVQQDAHLLNAAGTTSRPIGNVRMFLEDMHARGFRPRGIIDVGANRGYWTSMALSVFPGTRVILIEPQQEMQPFLKRLSEESQGLKMEVIQAGAGKEAGQLVQTIWEDLDGSSFLPEPDEEKLRKGTQRVTPIVTIDSLLMDRTDFNPDLVKLDIQGFEIEALKGATSLFGRTEVFIIETSLYEFMPKMPITADVINFMADNGYNLYDVTEFLRRPIDGALGQIDLAFVLKGGRFRKSNRWNAE